MAQDKNLSCFQPGEWVKGKMIGSGSFGSIHVAMNKASGQLFVVKSSKSRIGLKSLENEANILMSLNSPFVVKCFGKEVTYGQSNCEYQLNIFMEHMGGGSLSDLLDKFGGALSEGAIRSYTRKVLMGLDHLYENRIVHCDIKCTNVLLDSYGNVKLADFGCAQKLHDFGFDYTIKDEENNNLSCSNQPLTQVRGTPLWMAPELIRGEDLNYSMDIWSLGCMIIEMATGKPPSWSDKFSNDMTLLVNIAIGNEKPRFPDNFSPEGLDFLEKCLQSNTNNRWTAKELLCHPFISGTRQITMNAMRKDAPPSPTSILDLGKFDIGYNDNSEDELSDGSDMDEPSSPSIFPMSLKNNDMKVLNDSSLENNIDLEMSGTWITVRSA